MKNKIKKRNGPIEGKVAGVLNERELTINIGRKDGVIEDMRFKILADKPLEIYDPESNDLLGTVDREKVQVQVSEVHEKFSVCMTFRKSSYGIDLTSFYRTILPSFKAYETLKTEDSTLPTPLSEAESYVKKGDRVIQVVEIEES